MKKTLNQLAHISAGFSFRGKIVDELDGEGKVLQMKDVEKDNGIHWESMIKTNVPLKKLGEHSDTWLKDGDIIFTARGHHNYAYEITGCPSKTVLSPHLFKIQIMDISKVIPAFLSWQINQKPAQAYFSKNIEGSVIVGIRRTMLDKLPIFIPPIEEQYKIIKMIRCWEKERDTLHHLQENHRKMMDAIASNILQGNQS
ncbi:MAG: restriction endonuclease subunit S [Mariprofundaceae bacterium]|nr:restriction endonuclease subunit S [Mariprofundaceae bacterium]